MNNIPVPSNRNFGIVFFLFFLIISLWPLINGNPIRIWAISVSLVFLILGILNSNILGPINKVWMKFGRFLGNIISPIVMTLIFFGVVFPTGFLMRMFCKDIMSLKFSKKKNTYWIDKDNSNNNMKNQF
jgi:hypothetical protein